MWYYGAMNDNKTDQMETWFKVFISQQMAINKLLEKRIKFLEDNLKTGQGPTTTQEAIQDKIDPSTWLSFNDTSVSDSDDTSGTDPANIASMTPDNISDTDPAGQ